MHRRLRLKLWRGTGKLKPPPSRENNSGAARTPRNSPLRLVVEAFNSAFEGTQTFPKSLRALTLGGTVSVIGGVSGFASNVALSDILGTSALIRGNYVGNHDCITSFRPPTRALMKTRRDP
jgi:hypothetical protein